MKLKVLFWQEQDQWCASVPALPGCHTWGNSYDHLMEMVKEAVEGWLEVASEQEEAIANRETIATTSRKLITAFDGTVIAS